MGRANTNYAWSYDHQYNQLQRDIYIQLQRGLDYFTWLNQEFRSDIQWWHTFIDHWNGLSLLRSEAWSSPADHCIQTNASGSWGCGAFFEGKWLQWQWPSKRLYASIMAKELIPITLCCAVWGPKLTRYKVLIHYDNLSLVNAISKGSSKEKDVMRLLRCMWFFTAYFDIDLHVEHIAGVYNTTANQLSRNYMQSFFSSHPQASTTNLTPASSSTNSVLTRTGLDITSLQYAVQRH